MALFDKDARRVWLGIGIGAGALLSAPYVVPALRSIVRPVFKAALLESMLAFERGREAFAHAAEMFDDVIAEVRVELDDRLAARAEATAAAPTTGDGHRRGADAEGR
jgi:hypothetical protein